MNILGDVKIFKDKTIYFPLADDKFNEFELCKPYLYQHIRIIRNKVYIRFQWDLVVLFASKSQLITFDKMRKQYIQDLVQKHCSKEVECYAKFVGSDTPKSDIDINFSCPNAEKVLSNIYKDHAKHYNDSLDEMFDTNLYGSVFRFLTKECSVDSNLSSICYPKHSSDYNQRIWSFLRIAQNLNSTCLSTTDNVIAVLPQRYKKLLNKATLLSNKLQKKKDRQYWYKTYLASYIKILKTKNDPKKISKAFSMCKFFENDAYYTVGAVLHIVEQQKDVEPNSLYDSIYDNLGFAIETMFSYGTCHSLLTLVKISKMCKYIARICDAYKQLTNKTSLDKLYTLCEKINIMRKKPNILKSKMHSEIQTLFKLMTIQSDNKEDVVIGVVRFVLNVIPSDPLL